MKRIFKILSVFTSLFMSGCTYCTYASMVHNTTNQSIYDVTVYSEGLLFDCGTVISKTHKAYCGEMKFNKSVPTEIKWTTMAGEEKRGKVVFRGNPGMNSETHFVISDKGVTLYILPKYYTGDEWIDFLIKIGEKESKDFPDRK